MKKNHYIISLLGLCLLAMTGCSQEEVEKVNTPKQGTRKMLLTSTVSQTRSINQKIQSSQLSNGNTVGAYVTDEDDGILSDNTMLTADGDGGFTYEKDLFWPVEGKAYIYAYAPYQEGWKEKLKEDNTFTVAADQTTDSGYLLSDLVYGTPTVGNPLEQTESAVAISFVHKLVKINISVKNYTETDLGGSTVRLQNVANTTTINLKTGALGTSSGKTTISAATFASDATTFNCSAIIVPQKLAAGSEYVGVVLKSGGMLAAKLRNDMELLGGKTYNFTINVGIGGPEMTISSAVTDWDDDTEKLVGEIDPDDIQEPDAEKLYATFGTPGSNASYSSPTYTWTAGNSNLMTCFEFANGELKNYKKLKFKISNLTKDASVRMGYYVGTEWTEFGNGFYSEGDKEVDLTALGIDLSTVTKISFGGKSGSGGSVDILATEVYLEGSGSASSGDSSGGSSDGSSLTATFGTPGSNASYSAPTYTWTAGNSNLMTCFEFSKGELKDYKKLTFTFSNLTKDASVRMGYYVGNDFTEFGNGYYSAGTKEVDLTALGIDLSTVTKISFGGRSGSGGSCDIKASDVILTK
ncbi:MAG: fimbrillin family protein [Prevotella sp.]|nr:fimbrillin family protein [Prevotella sp.]